MHQITMFCTKIIKICFKAVTKCEYIKKHPIKMILMRLNLLCFQN